MQEKTYGSASCQCKHASGPTETTAPWAWVYLFVRVSHRRTVMYAYMIARRPIPPSGPAPMRIVLVARVGVGVGVWPWSQSQSLSLSLCFRL